MARSPTCTVLLIICLALLRPVCAQSAASAVMICFPGAEAAASSANLVQNPGNDEPLVNGEIPGWFEAVGTQWTQDGDSNSSQSPQFYFYSGSVAQAELWQDIDVTEWAPLIDAGVQSFSFSGWVRSFPQNPPDSTRIKVEYRHAVDVALYTYDSTEIQNAGNWKELTDTHVAPIGTRTIRIKLITKRYVGNSNDAYFDSISLVANGVQPFEDLGGGLAGAAGVPALAGHGTLTAGSAGSIELSGAVPLAFTNLLVSLANASVPFKGGTLSAVPPMVQVPVSTLPDGSWLLPWSTWPSGIPSGFEWFLQVVVIDPSAPEGFAISNLVRGSQP